MNHSKKGGQTTVAEAEPLAGTATNNGNKSTAMEKVNITSK
jgi:hypothetical protein